MTSDDGLYHAKLAYQARYVVFPPLNPTAREEALAKLDYYIDPLRKLAPSTGAYMNEVCKSLLSLHEHNMCDRSCS